MDYINKRKNKNKLRMVLIMKKFLSIVTCSIFILLASSIYSSCYATPSGLTTEQLNSEIEALKLFNQKMKIVFDLTKFISHALNTPYSNDQTEQQLISDLNRADDLLSKLLERELPIPDTTIERKRIYMGCYSSLDDICISGKGLAKKIINCRQNNTPENNKSCDEALLELYKNINILKARFGTIS